MTLNKDIKMVEQAILTILNELHIYGDHEGKRELLAAFQRIVEKAWKYEDLCK